MRKFFYGLFLGALLLPLIAALSFLAGWSPVQATADPPSWETVLARASFDASVARQAPKIQNPFPPTSENLLTGLKIYRNNCSGCHGDSGKPSHWGTSAFYPRVPQFHAEPPNKPDWQMFWIVKHGVRYTGMGAWEGEMSDENIWKVVAFLTHLKDLPPDVQKESQPQ